MTDFKNFPVSPEAPALDAFPITPGVSALTVVPRAIRVDGGGTLQVITYRGRTITFTLQDGETLPLVVTHVLGGTATGVVGFE